MSELRDVAIVTPTIGRPSLRALLEALASNDGPPPREIVLVDDRRAKGPLEIDVPPSLSSIVRVVRGRGIGPAAARNDGWRSAKTAWIAFLDDDVLPPPGWLADLAADLTTATAEGFAASAGRIAVPLPLDRRPSDWERNVAGLQVARWATADLAFRRDALIDVAGFDERFRRAYREDADLALRLRKAGHRLTVGNRVVEHPVRPAGRLFSLTLQRGNADDALMRALHGRRWRSDAEVFPGRRRAHVTTTAAAAAAVVLGSAGKRRLAAACGAAWALATTRFAWERIAPGPCDPREVATMAVTSVAIPPLAVWWWAVGWWRSRGARPWPDRPTAVLFDRDGTLVKDVPYNGNPDLVELQPGARDVVETLRARGIRVGVVTNQSGVGRGKLTEREVKAVNTRLEELVGPIGAFEVCPHTASDGCRCRKPAPGLITAAAAALGAHPKHCVVIGDIGSDVEAARNAGAPGILVPTPQTRDAEVKAARHVAADLRAAVRLALRPDFVRSG
ncbi:MAG TPA: HAD-IIIA family hydrolase [Acidothermaceae bacterium]